MEANEATERALGELTDEHREDGRKLLRKIRSMLDKRRVRRRVPEAIAQSRRIAQHSARQAAGWIPRSTPQRRRAIKAAKRERVRSLRDRPGLP